MHAGGDRRAGRLWWAGPTALVVLGGTAFAFVLAPELTGTPRVPDHVVIQPAATKSAASAQPAAKPTHRPTRKPTPPPNQVPTQQPTGPRTGEPNGAVVSPTRPVVSESPDAHESEGGDDGTHHHLHSETG